jgi:hypothetical protein
MKKTTGLPGRLLIGTVAAAGDHRCSSMPQRFAGPRLQAIDKFLIAHQPMRVVGRLPE